MAAAFVEMLLSSDQRGSEGRVGVAAELARENEQSRTSSPIEDDL